MKLALVESNILWENKQGNYEKLAGVLEALSTSGRLPEVIALPEMSFTGFSMNTELTAEIADEDNNYPTVEVVKRIAERYNVSIAFGWVKRDGLSDSLAENHYSIVSQHGDFIFDYTKIHPFSYSGEDRFFRGGDSVSVCRLREFTIGCAICYDLRFPEVFQAMSDNSGLIFVPANWAAKRREHFITLCRARAIENQCYIAAVNCRGNIGGVEYYGDSMLISPDGSTVTPVLNAEIGTDRVLLYDVANDVDAVRRLFPTRKDRRNDIYISILRKS